jgi:hypothetical protein
MLCTGCPPPPKVQPVPPEQPPRTIEEIVATIEANAARLDQAFSLWSNSVAVTARFTDRQGKEHVYNLDGNFLFQPPQRLRMDLRPSMGDQVMQIGSNDADYWVWIEPEWKKMWWGRYVHVGKPCTETIAVRPDQLVAALGLGGLPNAEEGLIGPVRKYGRTHDILYYMRRRAVEDEAPSAERSAASRRKDGGSSTTHPTPLRPASSKLSPGYRLEREFWVDRLPPYLIRVVLFRDALGRETTSAFLDDYRAAWEGGPLVPHAVSIIWHQDNGKFTMFISRVQGLPAEKVGPRAFLRPTREELPAGVTDVIQVDADCDIVYTRGRGVGSGEAGKNEEPPGTTPPPRYRQSEPAIPFVAPRAVRPPPTPAASSTWVFPGAAGATSWVQPSLSDGADWLRPEPGAAVPRGWPDGPRE